MERSRSSDPVTRTDELSAGRESFARRAWTDAYALLSSADKDHALDAEDLERLASAGLHDLYEGELAKRQVDGLRSAGCEVGLGDLHDQDALFCYDVKG